MTPKVAFVACVCAFAVQTISGQCIGAYNAGANALAWEAAAPWGAAPLGYAGTPYAAPWAAAPFAAEGLVPFVPSNGGGFTITSASPIAPTGVRVTSENAYEGPLAVSGNLPFLATVALEGSLPSVGSGAINYGCGNGNVAILNEDFGYNGPLAYRADIAGSAYGYNGFAGPLGYEAGIAGPSYGYNGFANGYGSCGCGAYY